jgi:hypothetical protein
MVQSTKKDVLISVAENLCTNSGVTENLSLHEIK